MTPRFITACVFIVFLAFSTWVTLKVGYFSAFPPFPELNTTQIFWDLAISLNIILYLAYQLLRERNLPLWPLAACAVGVVFVGSLAPLLLLTVYPGLHRKC